jgi:hypothetical protein
LAHVRVRSGGLGDAACGGSSVTAPQFLRVRNWEHFQHYKDRRPPWIKLHVELTDDYAFASLSDAAKFHLLGIWLLAARTDNKIPNDAGWIAAKIGADKPVGLDELVRLEFLVPWRKSAGGRAKWPSRYVSAALREQIMARDLRSCRHCTSSANLEIDHVVPVSRGGTSSADNLQVLCRSCNRAKRAKDSAEHVATRNHDLRSKPLRSVLPETETETETETERERTRAGARGKPFRCEVAVCGLTFASAAKLADHRANVHGLPHIEAV